MLDLLDEHTQHPWIAMFLAISLGFLLASAASELLVSNKYWAGFLGVYAVIMFAVAVFGFISAHFLRYISRRQSRKFNQ